MKAYKLTCGALLFAFILSFSSCGNDDSTDPTDEGNGGNKGSLTIFVKKAGNDKTFNNFGCLAVLGKSLDSMGFFKYKTSKLDIFDKQKVNLENFHELSLESKAIDTAYSIKGAGADPNSGEKTGVITFSDLEAGTYALHVLDANRHKAVLMVEVKSSQETIVTAETRRLGHLKVKTQRSTIGGSELNESDVRIYGYSSDTLEAVLTGAVPSDITVDYYYRAVTKTQKNENGNSEPGITYFFDIPVRRYYVAAYHNNYPKNQDQGIVSPSVRENLLSVELITFQ